MVTFAVEEGISILHVHKAAVLQGHSMRNGAHPLTAVNAPSLQMPFCDIPLKDTVIFTLFLIVRYSLFHCTPARERENLTLCIDVMTCKCVVPPKVRKPAFAQKVGKGRTEK